MLRFWKSRPELVVVLAGVSAALHVGKLSPAVPLLQQTMQFSLLQAGFLVSLVQLAGMLFGLLIGLWADAIGPRRSMLIGLLLLSLASVAGGFASDIESLLVWRAVEGMGFLLACMPAPGLIRSMVPAARINSALGVWGAYMPFGTALALLFGPFVLVAGEWRYWWWTVAAISLGMATWLWRSTAPDGETPRARPSTRRAADAGRDQCETPRAWPSTRNVNGGATAPGETTRARPPTPWLPSKPPAQCETSRAQPPTARNIGGENSHCETPRARPPTQAQEPKPVMDAGWIWRVRCTLGTRGPWLVAFAFAAYSAQWLAVVGFLPSMLADSGLPPTWMALPLALAAAVNMVGNIAAGYLLERGALACHLLYIGFTAMAVGALVVFVGLESGAAGAGMIAWRYSGLVLFSMVGGMIPGTLFSMAVELTPQGAGVSTTIGWVQQCSALGQFAGPPLVAWVAAATGGWSWSWCVTGVLAAFGLWITRQLQRMVPR